ncbi:MAG: DNA internalization-related competence protein ComEC/Rec2 [Bacteroidetes bacterium]|nr:DNA internalization-related competence protein ComEC/Rec2 [Bacteroidota bacterium]MCW5894491.1 DNA internalization-related competence protein ComEC/Rec2 [Bacteroidota bacterium]
MKKRTIRTTPALIVALLFAIGILLGKAGGLPFAFLFVLSLFFLNAAVFQFLIGRDGHPLFSFTLGFLVICSGAAKVQLDFQSTPSPIQSNRVVEVVGRIVEPPSQLDNKTRFTFQAISYADSSVTRAMDSQILVTVVRRKKDTLDVPFRYGATMELKGQLARPSPQRNPGEFDARKYYDAQGIAFVMRVRGYENVAILDSSSTRNVFEWLMQHAVIPVRHYMILLFDNIVGGEEAELLKGIFVGDRSGISYSTRNAFANSGISHLLAVSGAHVVIVWGVVTMVLTLVRLPRQMVIVGALIAVAFYMLLTGSNPPIVRATIMGGIFQGARLLGVKSDGLNSLGFAALLILGYDARQIYDVGFQLSFAAVFSLVYLFPIAKDILPTIKPSVWCGKIVTRSIELSMVTFVATVGTFPLMAVYFGKVSVVGLLTNIAVVPAVAGSITLGFLSALFGWLSPFVAETFAQPNVLLLRFVLWTAEFSGSLPWAYINTLQFRPIHTLPFYAMLGVLFHLHAIGYAKKFVIGFVASLNLLLIVPVSTFDRPLEEHLRVSFIDVGQGDAALIEFPGGETMLIDAGPKSEEYDAGERVVAPFLRRRGISSIDYLVASHPHADHIGGFKYIFDRFEVKEVIESGQPARDPIYIEYAEAVRNEGCNVNIARTLDSSIHIGEAKVYLLYPTTTFIDTDTTRRHPNLNNTSVVFKLCFGEISFLFTGDAEMDAELEMTDIHGEFLQSTLLKAGHHGSKTSSTQEFLDYVKPAFAVISAGVNNKFNHPSEEVVGRLRAMNVEILRTDEEGAILFETNGKELYRVDWR